MKNSEKLKKFFSDGKEGKDGISDSNANFLGMKVFVSREVPEDVMVISPKNFLALAMNPAFAPKFLFR